MVSLVQCGTAVNNVYRQLFVAVFTNVNHRGFRKVRKPLFFVSNWPFETKKKPQTRSIQKTEASSKYEEKT